jgi:hypothetical protein
MLPPCLSPRAPFTTTPQSGAPEYLLFLTEQAARPVIHAGLTGRRELFDEVDYRRGVAGESSEAGELGGAAEASATRSAMVAIQDKGSPRI